MGASLIASGALLSRLEAAVAATRDARRRRLASATVELEDAVADPSAVVFGSRLAGERWFCWEQPERDGFALAALGAAYESVSRGPDRFADIARDCAELTRDAVADDAGLPAGAGPVWTGGFAFDPAGGREPQWSSLPPALMVLPEISICRSGGRVHLTASVIAGAGRDADAALAGVNARLAALREAALTPADPQPGGTVRAGGRNDPARYEAAVAAATARIGAGDIDKVVLAREVLVESGSAIDPAGVFGALRELFGGCFCFCCGSGEAAFVGASPELLVRRSGAVAATVGLAGSTRRSADPSVDDHLGERLLHSAKDRHEHEIVVRRIERSLRPYAVWVQSADEPGLVKVANIQHLATPIHAQLAESHSAIELAGLMHPTPAVGGEPRERALDLIADLEQIDRGWYAGPVGWMDAAEDGEFCVALRSALLRDRAAHLYAGAGIVADSDPAAELAETELKLGALLPVLAA